MSTSDMEATVTILAHKEAIRDLARRYADCAWRRDAAGIVSLFSDDGKMDFGDVGGNLVFCGKAELLPGFEKMVVKRDSAGPFPMVHSHIVELRADTAVGTCYIDVRFVDKGKNVTAAGYYEDEYVRVDGEWKIRSRKLYTPFCQVSPA